MARRGLSLGSKLLLVSLLLLTLPWLAWRGLDTVESFLVDGQLRALELIASGSSTLLKEHTGRLGGGTGSGTTAIYAWPLDAAYSFDGYSGDWDVIPGPGLRFGTIGASAMPTGFGFLLKLGSRDGWLYGLVQVRDPEVVYRNPGQLESGGSDQVRLELHADDGTTLYRAFAAQGPGQVAALPGSPGWELLGEAPDEGMLANWQPNAGGYAVEFRLPLATLASHPVLRLAVLDARSGSATRQVVTLPLRPRYREPELEALLSGLAAGPARVWVVDRDGWVRASVGGPTGLGGSHRQQSRLDLEPLDQALAGKAASGRLDRAGGLLVSAMPLMDQGRVSGAVVVEQGLDDLLRLRYRTFAEFAVASLALVVLSLVALLLFAARLAWRIRRLGREAGAAIDTRGRLMAAKLEADAGSGDELGELSRAISGLLARLQRHSRFLEGLPRTLRHEISNPLNTLTTALQNLAEEPDPEARRRFLERAGRGLERLEHTLHALTEAANLEEALQGDPHTRLDLAALVRDYLESFVMQHPARHLDVILPKEPTWIAGVDHRIEQLLDKLFDNAADFTPGDGRISVSLRREGAWLRLEVANDGPALPSTAHGELFETLISTRARSAEGAPHLGIGLYVVRRIAEAHGGRAEAANGPGDQGAVFTVWLPVTDRPTGDEVTR
jgi:signal transduction histidine kinase